jgi:hypothetical protein
MRQAATKEVTASGIVLASNFTGEVLGVAFATFGAAGNFTLYEGQNNTGRVLFRGGAAANGQANTPAGFAIPFTGGLYAEISGLNAKAVVYV